MLIAYSEDHAAWKDAVEDFRDKTLRPLLATMDLNSPLTKDDWSRLRKCAMGKGVADAYPVDAEGEPDHVAFAILLEAMARVHSVASAFVTEQVYLPRFLGQLLSEEQMEVYGHHVSEASVIAACFSEPAAGSDTLGMSTTARRRENGDWIIRGQKTWISRGTRAELAIVYARMERDGNSEGMGLFLVEVGEGYHAERIDTLGLVAQDLCNVFLDDIVVPDIARISGDGRKNAFAAIGPGRASQALIAVGFAQAALDLAIPYALERQQFGRAIGGFQLVQGMLADMAIEVTASRLMAYNAVNALVRHGAAASRRDVSMAKVYCTEAAVRVASLGMEVQGAMGLTREVGAERIFRDARMLIVPDGTSQVQRLIIGREITGIDAIT